MNLQEQYIKIHNARSSYINETKKTGYTSFKSHSGWTDYIIDKNLVYSHRSNEYTKETFTEGLHVHDFYELIIYIDGNVDYVTDNYIVKPKPYSVIWFCPGQMHTATLLSPSKYERYVFYFSKEFFELNNVVIPMTDFMNTKNSNAFNPGMSYTEEIKAIIEKTDFTLKSDLPYSGLVAKALITELFGIFNKPDTGITGHTASTNILMQIKNYIDNQYAEISSSADVAEKFHYSREHISRKFKDMFNISISDYISKRRVLESLPLLNEMLLSQAAYTVGFKSQSAYISAFVKNMGYLPSEYKKKKYKSEK